MNTAVAASNTKECWPLNQGKSPCNVDPATRDQVHTGYVIEGGAFCNSACSWVLLAGVERIAGRNTYVGLHQPHGTEERWVDHYWDTWRIVNGKKHITSHRFIKRTYVKPIYIQGVRPAERPLYLKYIKEMGGSAQILDEMAKAAPSAINEVDASNGQRKSLGLITQTGEDVSTLISVDHCQAKANFTTNCVYRAVSEIQPAERCFIQGGCAKENGPQLVQPIKAQCFIASGCN